MECKCNSLFVITTALRELIDTLWNVNSIRILHPIASNRINRYIMECKCISQENDEPSGVLELIDTLWNVNTSAAEEPSGDAQN